MMSVHNLTIKRGHSLHEYFEKINEGRVGILLLVDDDGKLVRTLTDGDLRRLLLQGITLDSTEFEFPEKPPVTALEGTSNGVLLELMQKNEINQIPLLDKQGVPVSLVHLRDIEGPILLSTPHMGDEELEFVSQAFDTNWIAPLGPNVDAFEKELAEKVGIEHAAAVSSGTAAIHLALILLGVQPNDTVFCSTFTFVASANPILYQGATPVFIDSEPESWNMSPQALKKALQDADANGELPRAVIVVNIYGQSADMDKILAICGEYDVPVVEDAAESLGATYRDKNSGTFGRIGVYSFNGNKIITTSGGGMLVSHDGELIERARFLSTQARDQAPYYLHSQIGYNYRMSNVLAGIGRGQLRVLDERVAARRDIFDRYVDGLSDLEAIGWMPEADYGRSNRWLSCATIDPTKGIVSVSNILERFSSEQIEGRHLWNPMHRQPVFDKCKYYPHSENQSVSDELFERGLCLPSGSNMTVSQQQIVIDVLREAMA